MILDKKLLFEISTLGNPPVYFRLFFILNLFSPLPFALCLPSPITLSFIHEYLQLYRGTTG